MNIPSFTPEQQKENLKLGIKALRANPRKARYKMEDSYGGRCCLKVLSDTAEDICGLEMNTLVKNDMHPSPLLSEIYGLPNYIAEDEGFFDFLLGKDNIAASSHNDGASTSEKTHKEIADMIEEQYL